ncbi:MAG: phosphate acyltransferase PlsX [Thermoanaerobaculales bacterium]|jgi:glycerol-3-phosphate acyltransferase PlsX|nr:phosphate acyltransferase PlsX [Thermoanaerobaculales bacterium]
MAERAIALDVMGGDGPPQVRLQGAVDAVADFGLPVLLVGPIRRVRRELGRFRQIPSDLDLVDAADVVDMHDPPLAVLRGKRNSSLSVCADLVRRGAASAMVTAGNTGAAWVAAKSSLGMIDGVDRPALAAILPKRDGHTLVLDVGANVEVKPHQLVQFAVMGSFYASAVLGVDNPRVGLMSVGEEESKGGPRVRQQYQVLKNAGINFVGNVEGRDVFLGEVDVVVCDGFTGNVVLKVAEGLGEMVVGMLKEEARQSPLYGAGLVLAKGAFRNVKRKVDYSEHGGAPLLGVNGACLIGHGRSSAKAIRNAIRFADSYASSGVIRQIGDKILEVLAVRGEPQQV